ncbi:MAG: 3'(2'),5'-bisphosphate nucleotidase CysQ, partial [Bacteroidia bacterium]|nr:3'(2'),5'-bisphosphate nucleotidase CysQ [Bacteroidia bacterium]
MKNILVDCIRAAIEAGKLINEIYQTSFEVSTKPDNTPVTVADQLSSKKIISLLKDYQIPIVSEEEILPLQAQEGISKTNTFFIIDPLDGTREFIKKNGEFTINIALIENKEPVMGIVYA